MSTDATRPSQSPMVLSAFHQMTPSHNSTGFWKHPRSRSNEYNSIDFWIEYAQKLDSAGFDMLFFADIIGYPTIYAGGSVGFPIEHGTEVPLSDPTLAISALSKATKSLGFVATISTTYEHPYLLARKLTSLDQYTDGRFGWNIVTSPSFSPGDADAMGLPKMPHDERYSRAEEFLEVVYKLLEGSWEDGSVLVDRENGRYADSEKVHAIDHKGAYFTVPGAHTSEPSPQRTPMLFQAGSSTRGKQFAGTHAEGIFLASISAEEGKPQVDAIREAAVAAGRNPSDVKVLSFMTVVAGATDDEARAKVDEYLQYWDYEGQLAILSAAFGIDLSTLDPDEPLEHFESNSIQGLLQLYTKVDSGRRWTIREVAQAQRLSGWGPLIVGGPETVADKMEEWMQIAGNDGFMLNSPVLPLLNEDFIEFVVPILRERGLLTPIQTEPTTMRERIFGEGPYLPQTHTGSGYRR